MICIFGRPHPPKGYQGPFHIGTAWQFVEYMEEQDAINSKEYWEKYDAFDKKYPRCWDKFLHWLRIR